MTQPAPPCGVVTFDDELRVTAVNGVAGALLGIPPEALVGQPLSSILSRSAQIFFNTQVHPSLAILGRAEELYLQLLPADGVEVPVVLSAARELTPDGPRSTLAFLPMRRRQLFENELIAARDAAEAAARLEREAQVEIKHAHAQMAMRERLAALGTLAHGIAHEINNPLTYVVANLELLAEQVQRDPTAPPDPSLIQDALDGTVRIREITRQVGSMARAEEAPRGRLHPHSVVTLVARMTSVHTRARAQVEVELGEVPEIEGDTGRLGQVLINLVLNAAQAFGDRPRELNQIRITTRTAPDGAALLEVSDNGPGIPPEVAPRVFEPFFTTKAVGEGSGLGLSISRAFVESLGGTLDFETSAGGGDQALASLTERGLPWLGKPIDRAALLAWCEAHVPGGD